MGIHLQFHEYKIKERKGKSLTVGTNLTVFKNKQHYYYFQKQRKQISYSL